MFGFTAEVTGVTAVDAGHGVWAKGLGWKESMLLDDR
jgi:hypothetical protein